MRWLPIPEKKLSARDSLCINTIRFLSSEAVQKANSGHPGTPMALAPLSYILWTKYLKHNPKDPKWHNRDRFILSAGHASMLLYSMLHLTGYDLPLSELKRFRQWKSKTPGHPEYGHTAGVETTTGPLGQGIGNAVGMAMAEKHLAARFNKPGFPIVDHHTYAIVSDGDLMEGISHEACSLAGHLKLGKLIAFYDDNTITIDGKTNLAYSEDAKKRFESYGWHVQVIKDGNTDLKGMEKAIARAKRESGKPSLIIVKTTIGYGAPHKQDTAGAHGAPLGDEEIALAKRQLGWPNKEPFTVPRSALNTFRASINKGQKAQSAWKALYQRYKRAHPKLAKEYELFHSGKLPRGWERSLPSFGKEEKPIATRKASGKILNSIAPSIPNLVGGSADLHPSTNTYLNDFGSFSPKSPAARNFHYGIREHAMGAITNGMALHGGLIPLCSTFLVFSDYMRPTIRLAALMGIRSIFVFTHDSIGVGEDGPTHQPIEHVTALRAIPNVQVYRPADGNETSAAWRAALERTQGPSVIILTRQGLPTLSEKKTADAYVKRGAYILEDSKKKSPDIILMGTGSEVHHLAEAKALLRNEKIDARVVSMPSLERFRKQPASYKEKVLPSKVTSRLAIEAGIPLGWEEFIGLDGTTITIDRFGASAPGGKVMEKYGFTAKNVAKRAKEVLKRARQKR